MHGQICAIRRLGCVHSNNSSPCSDGNSCTTNDVCVAGMCIGGDRASGCNACSAVATIPPSGGTFMGTTGGSSTLSGSCGSTQTSGERVYRWTPSTSGTATIGTCGLSTRYDTVVYMRSGSCTGSQLSCNDDACAITGRQVLVRGLLLRLQQGQTYFIVVDGYGGASGAYALTVQPPTVCGNGVREGAEQCDGADLGQCATGQCTAQCTCASPPCGLPDMTPTITDFFVQRNTTVGSGDVAEGCAETSEWICCASVYRPTTLGLPTCSSVIRSVRSALRIHLRAVATPISSVALHRVITTLTTATTPGMSYWMPAAKRWLSGTSRASACSIASARTRSTAVRFKGSAPVVLTSTARAWVVSISTLREYRMATTYSELRLIPLGDWLS